MDCTHSAKSEIFFSGHLIYIQRPVVALSSLDFQWLMDMGVGDKKTSLQAFEESSISQ